jgi:hypothetical protein
MDALMPSKLPLLVLLLFASLLLAGTAQAVPASSTAVPFALEEELEFEEEEGEDEARIGECEEAEGEFAEGELTLDEVEQICSEEEERQKTASAGSAAPEECLLRSTHAHAVTNEKRNQLKLTLGYTTYEPTKATIQLHSGPTPIGSFKRYLGRSGVLRFTNKLNEKQGRQRVHVVIEIPSVRSAGCPSRRLVLFPR